MMDCKRDWENPSVFQKNRYPMHTRASVPDALTERKLEVLDGGVAGAHPGAVLEGGLLRQGLG